MARVVERNIDALLVRQRATDSRRIWSERVADAVTAFAGSMAFVFLHLVLFGGWVLWNVGALGLRPFDPSFVVLAMVASVEAIFLSTFILISQNRMAAQAARRAELDLQVGLLSEHEITRLLVLVTAVAHKLDVAEAVADPELTQHVHGPGNCTSRKKETPGRPGFRKRKTVAGGPITGPKSPRRRGQGPPCRASPGRRSRRPRPWCRAGQNRQMSRRSPASPS